MAVAAGDQLGPGAGLVQRRGRDPEVDVGVVGPDEYRAAGHVDLIVDAGLPGVALYGHNVTDDESLPRLAALVRAGWPDALVAVDEEGGDVTRLEYLRGSSYPGNLARSLEHGKIDRLTAEIEANLGVRPTLYRAGRYGAGANTRRILTDLGYTIDCSVLPFTDLSRWGGPDYSAWDVTPAWLDLQHRLLELPVTSALAGSLAGLGTGAYKRLTHPLGRRLHLPGVFARLGLLERIKLTPEGTTLAEAQRLTRSLLARGQTTFVITYHSSSLEPGFTRYVRTQEDLRVFLGWLESYCAWFMEEVGGVPSTAGAVYDRALAALPAHRES